jgi:maltose alpha-D-glucosyltransferase/alpha-amylase
MVPIELFGRAPFPAIADKPYFLTLSPHAAFWFSFEAATNPVSPKEAGPFQRVTLQQSWDDIFEGEHRVALERCLSRVLKDRPGFSRRSGIKWIHLRDAIALRNSILGFLLVLMVEYIEGEPHEYLLPVKLASGEEAEALEKEAPQRLLTRLRLESQSLDGGLFDAIPDAEFAEALLQLIIRRRSVSGLDGELSAASSHVLRSSAANERFEAPQCIKDQNNTGLIFRNRLFLKLFRKLEPGRNPELEVSRFLTEQNYPNIPPVLGWLQYTRNTGEEFTLGVLSRFLPNAQDAWADTLDTLSRYFERIRASTATRPPDHEWELPLLQLSERQVPDNVVALIGTYLEAMRLLGKRTGELHLALASDPLNRDFAPEPFTPFYQRSLYQSMRNLTVQNLQLLRQNLASVPERLRHQAERVINLQGEILKRLRRVSEGRILAKRTRCHGDLHLGQVLYTGKDFIFAL